MTDQAYFALAHSASPVLTAPPAIARAALLTVQTRIIPERFAFWRSGRSLVKGGAHWRTRGIWWLKSGRFRWLRIIAVFISGVSIDGHQVAKE